MSKQQRGASVIAALLLAGTTSGCGLSTTYEPDATFTGDPMTPNEEHRALEPCRDKLVGRGRVLLQVDIDARGDPSNPKVTAIGGNVPSAFVKCVELRLASDEYEPRGKATTIGRFVDI